MPSSKYSTNPHPHISALRHFATPSPLDPTHPAHAVNPAPPSTPEPGTRKTFDTRTLYRQPVFHQAHSHLLDLD